MKIIITASSDKIDQPFNPRFGRAEYFILIDSETREAQAFANPAMDARGGAGPQAVQFIAAHQPGAVISGRFGPNAFSALEAAGVKVYVASSGTVSEVLDQFLAGRLSQVSEASGPGMHGGGRGAGGGRQRR
jgi:predicted Fe-Mo cluster-binding NifX family protein